MGMFALQMRILLLNQVKILKHQGKFLKEVVFAGTSLELLKEQRQRQKTNLKRQEPLAEQILATEKKLQSKYC